MFQVTRERILANQRRVLTCMAGILSGSTFGWPQQQDGRLPAAYLAPSHFGKDAILRDENVFIFQNTLFLHHIFQFFPL